MAGTRPKGSAKRTQLLDAAERLIVQEGYAAVSTRRVALEAGVKPPLVHYYFPTTEDLLLAVYARAAEQAHQRTMEALTSAQPLDAFWRLSKESAHTALGTELYALANHRKAIGDAIAESGVAFRGAQAEALSRALGESLDLEGCTPVGLLVVVMAVSRILVMEEAAGVTAGHAEARALVDGLLRRVLCKAPAGAGTP